MKIYKGKEDKLILYLPFEVVEALKLKGSDEVDFFKFNENSFLFAKKSDITNLIVGNVSNEGVSRNYSGDEILSKEEIAVLKKLDILKYQARTKEKVDQLLTNGEKMLLQQLMKKKAVSLFANDKYKTPLYGISKNIYDRFLMRKKLAEQVQVVMQPLRVRSGNMENENVKTLEKDGFIVLQSEAEAASLSIALEDSIRHGLVVGTRSFNKKFYIVLRTFFDRYASKVLKALKEGDGRISEIATKVGVDEDGARAVLYLLSESGDVSESRRDVFAVA